ncbi:MAG: hypothetical protein ACUVWK_00010 [Nitrososphaerales archaeon]
MYQKKIDPNVVLLALLSRASGTSVIPAFSKKGAYFAMTAMTSTYFLPLL